jgi:hypothetical protein
MPRLFSYGSLQQPAVQQAAFGRSLNGRRDELVGFELRMISRGDKPLASVRRVSQATSRVPGTVFDITDAELHAADAYERADSYVRIPAALASGGDAWIYLDAMHTD